MHPADQSIRAEKRNFRVRDGDTVQCYRLAWRGSLSSAIALFLRYFPIILSGESRYSPEQENGLGHYFPSSPLLSLTLRDRRGEDKIAILRHPLFLREALAFGGRDTTAISPLSPLFLPKTVPPWREISCEELRHRCAAPQRSRRVPEDPQ